MWNNAEKYRNWGLNFEAMYFELIVKNTGPPRKITKTSEQLTKK